jgi:hypothetical protein
MKCAGMVYHILPLRTTRSGLHPRLDTFTFQALSSFLRFNCGEILRQEDAMVLKKIAPDLIWRDSR